MSSPTDPTAASKLKALLAVPATAPTLTADRPYIVLIELLRHAIVVADVHDDVLHATISSALVAVCSPTPKSSPETLTEPPPLGAAFRWPLDAIGASNVMIEAPVPTTPLTVAAIS